MAKRKKSAKKTNNRYHVEWDAATSIVYAATKKDAVKKYMKSQPPKRGDKRAFSTIYKNTWLSS